MYRARDTRLDRIVAIKVLPPDLTNDRAAKRRFDREARAVAALSHPHICPLFDIGHHNDIDFLVMEYLEGETLAGRLARGKPAFEQALQYGTQLTDGLAAAHRAGIIHRDLKPANIMLTKSGVRLLDFGLTKARAQSNSSEIAEAATDQPLTGVGMIAGTLPYMAPEQFQGKEADTRTDIFAVGAVLYEMLTGHRAFGGDSPAAVIGNILHVEPSPLSSAEPAASPALVRLVSKCIAKDPDARWQSASDVFDELALDCRRRRFPRSRRGITPAPHPPMDHDGYCINAGCGHWRGDLAVAQRGSSRHASGAAPTSDVHRRHRDVGRLSRWSHRGVRA